MIAIIIAIGCSSDTDTEVLNGDDEDDNKIVDLPAVEGWTLVWHDEFDSVKVDTSKWNIVDRENSHNNELQYYVPDEIYIEDEALRLRSRKREYGSKIYTSGSVNSRHKFYQMYGRFEISARLPRGQGIWPAIWLLPQAGQWPPEIDIMENLGHDEKTVYMTSHWGEHRDGWHPSNGSHFTAAESYALDFHTFTVEWEQGEIRWYIDGDLRHTVNQGVPDEPFYIILNTAVGGTWPGNPDLSTPFPQYHDIDYVRVYTKDD